MGKDCTLVYIFKDNKVLLGAKKYGGAKGKINGFGGKIEELDNNYELAAKREVEEETSLKLLDLELKGCINFNWVYKKESSKVYVFTSRVFSGEPKESKEMTVEWFDLNNIPKEKMWESDRCWFDYLLIDNKFIIDIYFRSEDNHLFDEMNVRIVDELDY